MSFPPRVWGRERGHSPLAVQLGVEEVASLHCLCAVHNSVDKPHLKGTDSREGRV